MRSQQVAIYIISLFFLPGTILHEFSHFFVAKLLFVKTFGMEFTPEYSMGRLKMGSVKVEKTDFLRSFVIGVAPLFVGASFLTYILWFLWHTYSYLDVFKSTTTFSITILIVFLLFMITNTMFSSKKDMEGGIELLVGGGVILVISYFAGFNAYSLLESVVNQKDITFLIQQLSILFAIPLGINILAIGLSFPLMRRRMG